MKKTLILIISAILLLTSLPLTACQKNTEPSSSVEKYSDLLLTQDGESEFSIIRSEKANANSYDSSASLLIRNEIRLASGANLVRLSDKNGKDEANTKEILIGNTNRAESQEVFSTLNPDQFVVKTTQNKIIICGGCGVATMRAAEYFCETYITEGGSIKIPTDVYYTDSIDFTTSTTSNMKYEEMGDVVLKAFADAYINNSGDVVDTDFWDAAEILEAFLDAYERTGTPEYLAYAEGIAKTHFDAKNQNTVWASNPYNDDIAWACIAFVRLYQFTNNQKYLTIAKNNFDIMWRRAYSSDLGGGLWWKDDERNCKNTCIQCPASIAACLIAKATNNDSYYEKAKTVMDWEIETLFNAKTGQVFDSISLENGVWEIVFSYNLGTFVGACTLLHEKYGDEKYITYAEKAVWYGMNQLENRGGVLNGENSGYDGIGFKGILTRWFYKYAEYTQNADILYWLQKNADAAYSNRNSQNIIWTVWSDKTPEGYLDPFSASSALALIFNCEPWW